MLDGEDTRRIMLGGASVTTNCVVDGMVLQHGYFNGAGGGALSRPKGASAATIRESARGSVYNLR